MLSHCGSAHRKPHSHQSCLICVHAVPCPPTGLCVFRVLLYAGDRAAHGSLVFPTGSSNWIPRKQMAMAIHLLLDPFVILIKTRLTLKRIRKSQVGFWGQIPQIKAFLTVITVKNALGLNNWSDFNTYYKNVILNRDFSSVVPQYLVEGNSHWTVMVWGRNEHNARAHN